MDNNDTGSTNGQQQTAPPATFESFDVNAFAAEDTAELRIVHPGTGKPTSWVWTIAGPGHASSIEQANRIAKRNLAEQRLQNQARVNGKKYIEQEKTPDQVRQENVSTFAERVLGWTPVQFNGQDYPFSQDNCVKLLKDPHYGAVYLQLMEFLQADDSFTKSSAKA